MLAAHGFQVITPDLRGFGRSSRPEGKDHYQLRQLGRRRGGVLDACGAPQAHVVGHDLGAAVAWLTAMFLPDRVRTLTALSVPHLQAPLTRRQREMDWYQLFFQFEGVAEATLEYDDWAEFRELTPGYKDIDRAIADLSRPGALTATLNWYRANLAPRPPGPRPGASAGDRAHARHLVRRRPVPGRRADARLRQARPGALALRGDRRRHPLDSPRRAGAPQQLLLGWLS